MNILDAIMAERRADAAASCRAAPRERLLAEAARRRHRSLSNRLRAGNGTCIIAETKKASPSAGLLRPAYDPAALARSFAAAGAVAISVLTEPRRFLGSADHLRAVRAAVGLPVLRKDFICVEYQVVEAAAWGADAILLIAAALRPSEMRRLYDAATSMGLEVLAEAHTAHDLDAVLELENAIVGVNSRDLRTLRTDLSVALELASRIPTGRTAVAESGIKSRADVEALQAAGYHGFLVGESLLVGADPGAKLRELVGT